MKNREEAFERCAGLYNITVTPFRATGELDFPALSRGVERILDAGYSGLLIGGTYGEFPTMSVEERAGLFRHVMSVVGERAPVMLCSAHSDPRIARDLTRLASDLGGLPMVTPPYVSEVTDDQIVGFIEAMTGCSRTGLMIYNAPGVGISLSADLIERIAEIRGIVALKQGDLSPATVDELCGRLRGRIRLLAASDLALLGPLALGFDGVSSTNSCALPELILAIYRAVESNDMATAGRLQRLWYPIRRCARRFGQPQTTKALMNLRGFQGGHVRWPLRDVSDAEKAEVADALERVAADPSSGIQRRAA